jgi:dephospho-CoA kinase
MKWVGLTGGLGTGKSTVSQILLKLGIPVVDADRLAREVTEISGPAYPEIVQAFGPGIQKTNGQIDRSRLAEEVFGHPEKLAELEKIIHPLVQAEVKKQKDWLEAQGTLWAVYDVPLLFEKSLQNQFDAVVVVAVHDPEIIKTRLRHRNAWNDQEIQKRTGAQRSLNEKVQAADYVIWNDASLTELEKEVATLVLMLNDLWKD